MNISTSLARQVADTQCNSAFRVSQTHKSAEYNTIDQLVPFTVFVSNYRLTTKLYIEN